MSGRVMVSSSTGW
jgi:hypothetical protein